jgi:signal transduction histidine kinase
MSTIPSLFRQAKRSIAISVAVGAGGGAAIGGFVSMLGWMLSLPRFIDWDLDGVTIKFNAAVATTAAGTAILVSAIAPQRRMVVRILASLVLALGSLTLIQHLTGASLGLDTLIFHEAPGSPATSSPGRMGIPASLSSTFLGFALLLISFRKALGIASLLGLAVALVAWMPISGYLFGAPQLFAFVPFTAIASQTAFILLFLGIGTVAVVPTHGLAEVLARQDAGGRLFRSLFIPLILLSVGLNWVRMISVNSGVLDFAASGALRSILELVVLMGLLWWAALSVSRADAAKASERKALLELDTHRMVNTAQEAERRRIARDIHDSVGQELTGLRLLLHNLPNKFGDENLRRIEQQAARLDIELSMLVWQLRPKVLDMYGLVDTLDNFSRAWAASSGIDVQFHSSLSEKRLPSDVETNLYRIAQEALNNIQKHARAKEVLISLDKYDAHAILTIQDDGRGFNEGEEDEEAIHSTESGGFGLIGMRERATVIGGRFDVESRPGEGTCITVRVPLQSSDEHA